MYLRFNLEWTCVFIIILGFLSTLLVPIFLSYAIIGLGVLFSIVNIWKNPVFGVYLTIFFLPLTKTLSLPVIGAKITLADFLFGVTFLTYLSKKELNIETLSKKLEIRYIVPLFLFLTFAILSIFNAISRFRWASEIITYLYLSAFFVFIIFSLDDDLKRKKAVDCLLTSLCAVVLIGFIGYVLNLFGILANPFIDGTRLTSTFKTINQLSLSLLVGFFLILYKSEHYVAKNNKMAGIFWLIVSMLSVVVLILSGTKFVLLVLIPLLVAHLIFKVYSEEKNIAIVNPLLVLSLSILLIFVPLGASKGEILTKFEEVDDATYSGEGRVYDFVRNVDPPRYFQLKAVSEIVYDYPILGVGAGNFRERIKEYSGSPEKWEMHNTFLGIVAETGILGFSSFLIFITSVLWIPFRRLIEDRKIDSVYLSLFLGVLGHFGFSLWHFGLRNRHLWLGLALLVASSQLYDKSRKNI